MNRCSLCHGEGGYHVNDCPRHDEALCPICRKIAAIGPLPFRKSA